MTENLTTKECLEFLRAIESREITLSFCGDEVGWDKAPSTPAEVYAGNCPYHASNGWKITVFNDCDSWDYVDRIEAADGRSVDFDDMEGELKSYSPTESVAFLVYGIDQYSYEQSSGLKVR